MKKFLAFFMSCILLFSISGCTKAQTNPSSPQNSGTATGGEKESMTLLYSLSDSFNPYEALTDQNRQICRLIFEPLIKTDNEFNAVFALAKDARVEGNICTVTLKTALFSDGSQVTAEDVVYSFKAATAAKGVYAAKLYEVKSVEAQSTDTVVFTLNKQDKYFINVLDFPVFKAGSDKLTDEDSVKLVPVGAGKYVFNDDKTELVQNPKYYGGNGSIKNIRLINAPDGESVSHYVEIGAVDMYFNDISDGEIIRMSGQKTDINLNSLVYIGVNHSVEDLSLSQLRQAISSGINRDAICSEAYYNNALSAKGFFTPVWQVVKSVQNIQTSANSQITIENLEEIGYNSLDSEGIRRQGGKSLRYTLLVNTENRSRTAAAEMIASQLKEYGIKLTVIKVGFEDYKARLESGNFQLYLGEVKITENMDISPLVTEGGSVAFGIKYTKPDVAEGETQIATSADIINSYYNGTAEITDVVSVLQTEMPIIPICFPLGVLFSNDGIDIGNASQSDIFLNIN